MIAKTFCGFMHISFGVWRKNDGSEKKMHYMYEMGVVHFQIIDFDLNLNCFNAPTSWSNIFLWNENFKLD
jgi:hypothetical protein